MSQSILDSKTKKLRKENRLAYKHSFFISQNSGKIGQNRNRAYIKSITQHLASLFIVNLLSKQKISNKLLEGFLISFNSKRS